MAPLDIDLLRAFVTVADYANFTAAGARLGATQSAISSRIRKLEERLGHRLLYRSPHEVSLTEIGTEVLIEAQNLLRLHDELAAKLCHSAPRPEFRLGVSDHATTGQLAPALITLRDSHPDLRLRVTIDASETLQAAFTAGKYDAVIVTQPLTDTAGHALRQDRLCWAAAHTFQKPAQQTALPVISLASDCLLRRTALTRLKDADLAHDEVLLATGVAAVQTAVAAGLGVACLPARNIPEGCLDVGQALGLPPLGDTQTALHHRGETKLHHSVVAVLKTVFSGSP